MFVDSVQCSSSGSVAREDFAAWMHRQGFVRPGGERISVVGFRKEFHAVVIRDVRRTALESF